MCLKCFCFFVCPFLKCSVCFYVARAHSEVSPDKTNENYLSQGKKKQMLMPPYACTIPKIQYKEELGQGTAISETPEMERVKRNQEAISTVHCGVTPSFTLLPAGVPPKCLLILIKILSAS